MSGKTSDIGQKLTHLLISVRRIHEAGKLQCNMNASEIEQEFFELCRRADSADTLEAGVPDLEPYLLAILHFVKANMDQRERLVRCFTALVDGSRTDTRWIVLFCMRELRWPEIQLAANRRFELAGGVQAPSLMNWIGDINWAYDDAPWDHADFFLYFWKMEHPGEPWPCQPAA